MGLDSFFTWYLATSLMCSDIQSTSSNDLKPITLYCYWSFTTKFWVEKNHSKSESKHTYWNHKPQTKQLQIERHVHTWQYRTAASATHLETTPVSVRLALLQDINPYNPMRSERGHLQTHHSLILNPHKPRLSPAELNMMVVWLHASAKTGYIWISEQIGPQWQ